MEIIIAIFIIWILWAWVKQKYKILRKKGEIISTIDNLEANSSLPLSPDLETKDMKQRTQSSSPKTLSSEPTWFADFEHFISECLKLSLSNAKIKAELENNPKLNKIFIQLRENNTISQEAQRPAKHGIETGPTSSVCTEPFKHHLIKNYPKNPRLSLDEAKNALSRKRHAEELKKHNDFIGVTLSKLKSQQFAVQEFGEILHSVGMEEILEQHFPSIARVQNKHQVTQVENHQSTENPRHKMIKAIAQRRGVFQLVHFTRVENVESILDHGIKPVSQLINDNSTFIRNDNMRLDNHLDAISMSISFPNFKTFYKMRMESKQSEWAVLILKPEILWEKVCSFFPLNAADSRMRRKSLDLLKDPSSFEEMFSITYGDRENFLNDYDPTNSQAEVMVFGNIELDYIDAIAFETVSAEKKFEDNKTLFLVGDYDKYSIIEKIKVLDQPSSASFFGTREKFYSPF